MEHNISVVVVEVEEDEKEEEDVLEWLTASDPKESSSVVECFITRWKR